MEWPHTEKEGLGFWAVSLTAIVHGLLWEWGLTLEEEVLFNKKQIPKWDSAGTCQMPTAQGEVRSGLLTAAYSVMVHA